jgi:hypothetical protein
MEESRRDFLKKTGKAILTGAGWSAISLLGIGAAGCGNSGYSSCSYYTDCNYCTNCTSSYTYGDDRIRTDVILTLGGSGFSSDNIYTIKVHSSLDTASYDTDEYGYWTGNQYRDTVYIDHKKNEDVVVEVSKSIFPDQNYSEKTTQAFNTDKDEVSINFTSFPVGVYFSVKFNQNNSPIGTVNVTVNDQANNVVTTGTTNTNGIIKLSIADDTNPQNPIKIGIPYTAVFSKTTFKNTTQSFTVQPDSTGIVNSSTFVVYMLAG